MRMLELLTEAVPLREIPRKGRNTTGFSERKFTGHWKGNQVKLKA